MQPQGNATITDSAYLLGVRIDCLRRSELLDRVLRAIHYRHPLTIHYVNAHCLNVQHRDGAYHDILADADIVYADGAGVLLGARLSGQSIPERMTGADWIHDLCELAVERDLSFYLLGASTGVVQGTAAALRSDHPGLRIVGEHDGYDLGTDIVPEINDKRPDILLVGMGVPVQEKWIAGNRPELDVPVVWGVGGLFDLVSGRVRRGPTWMTQNGLEWFCRLMVEPRRLWRRYLLGNPRFLWYMLTNRTIPAHSPQTSGTRAHTTTSTTPVQPFNQRTQRRFT